MEKCIVLLQYERALIASDFSFNEDVEDLFDLVDFHFRERVDLGDPERFGLLVVCDFFRESKGFEILSIITQKDGRLNL